MSKTTQHTPDPYATTTPDFKTWLIKKIGKTNYIDYFPNRYSEIELLTLVDDFVAQLQRDKSGYTDMMEYAKANEHLFSSTFERDKFFAYANQQLIHKK